MGRAEPGAELGGCVAVAEEAEGAEAVEVALAAGPTCCLDCREDNLQVSGSQRGIALLESAMKWSWIDLNFPWIGSIAAVILLILLLATSVLRSALGLSRSRDLTWLSWLAVAVYLIHNVEEYGVDLLGQFHAFPHFMCAMLAQPPYPSCPIPPPFYLAVNLPLFWVGAPLAAALSRRLPILGLSVYGVIFVNALTHVGAFVHSGYNAGVLTALILFLPTSFWVAKACFGKDALPYGALGFIVADGVFLHAVLMVSTMLFLHGIIGPAVLTDIQILNANLFFVLACSADIWRSGFFFSSSQSS